VGACSELALLGWRTAWDRPALRSGQLRRFAPPLPNPRWVLTPILSFSPAVGRSGGQGVPNTIIRSCSI
jgi:hypothetical protein